MLSYLLCPSPLLVFDGCTNGFLLSRFDLPLASLCQIRTRSSSFLQINLLMSLHCTTQAPTLQPDWAFTRFPLACLALRSVHRVRSRRDRDQLDLEHCMLPACRRRRTDLPLPWLLPIASNHAALASVSRSSLTFTSDQLCCGLSIERKTHCLFSRPTIATFPLNQQSKASSKPRS